MIELFRSARRVSTPLIAVRSMDPAATQFLISKEYETSPLATWDAVNGLRGMNGAGVSSVKKAAGQQKPEELTSPVEMLASAAKLDKETILFMHNPQMFMSQGDQAAALITQAIWNLRDMFKMDRRTLVMLGAWFMLPPEINQDVVVLDEPLPTDEQLGQIVLDQHKAAKLRDPDKKMLAKAVDALRGLAAFSAEQVTAMSLTKDGLNMEGLWVRKIQTVEQTPGLSIWQGKESFDTVKGYDNAQNFLAQMFGGKEPPNSILFIDEIEKHLAGATGGDLSGVKQDMLGALLVWMQDRKSEGVLFIGVPGSGKSALAKATGNYANVLDISFDLAGMQESLVGSSGRNIRTGLKVVDAISGGRCLVIATCNSLQSLPPELRRRFSATFFFDLPNLAGRAAIWDLYQKVYKIKLQELPDDDQWTGSEIEKACKLAWRLECSLIEAAKYVVPVAKSAPEQLAFLRNMANGTFLSATNPGIYQIEEAKGELGGRKMDLQ